MEELKEWLGDVFYKQVTKTTTREGYESSYEYRSSSYAVVELPFEEIVTETYSVVDMQAVGALILVLMVFLTVVTWIRGAIR